MQYETNCKIHLTDAGNARNSGRGDVVYHTILLGCVSHTHTNVTTEQSLTDDEDGRILLLVFQRQP